MGTPGNSAFSVPLAIQAFPTFHTYQRALPSMAPASLKSPLTHLAPTSPRLGERQSISCYSASDRHTSEFPKLALHRSWKRVRWESQQG